MSAKKLFLPVLMLLATVGVMLAIRPEVSFAAENTIPQDTLVEDAQCKDGNNSLCVTKCTDPASGLPNPCGGTPACEDTDCNLVNKYLNPFINVLTILVGITVVIGIMVGGIQYASSGGDPQKAASAKNRIRTTIVALIVFFFLYAMLKFFIPGEGLLIG